MKKLFSWINFFGTIMIMVSIYLLSFVPISLDFLNVFGQILDDYHVTDLVFTTLNKDKKSDSTIVIVNIGSLDRVGMAEQINQLNKAKPAVLALDIRLTKAKDNEVDSVLEAAFRNTKNLVLASELINLEKEESEKAKEEEDNDDDDQEITFDSLKVPLKRFRQYAKTAFVNVITDDDTDFETWRVAAIKEKYIQRKLKKLDSAQIKVKIAKIDLKEELDSVAYANIKTDSVEMSKWKYVPTYDTTLQQELGLGIQMALFYDSTKTKKFLERGNAYEEVNYLGNTEKFIYLDAEQVREGKFDPKLVAGKIVLMGYHGTDSSQKAAWDEDKYYSPMNPRQIGRTTPDMYGMIGHANIISMILNETHIYEMEDWQGFLFAIIVCYFNVSLFIYLKTTRIWIPWYEGVTKLIQLTEIAFFVYLTIFFFDSYNIKLDLSLALVAALLAGELMELYIGIILKKINQIRNRR